MANKKEPESKEIRYDRFLGNQGDSMDFFSDTPDTPKPKSKAKSDGKKPE